jgi:hypothetical protein
LSTSPKKQTKKQTVPPVKAVPSDSCSDPTQPQIALAPDAAADAESLIDTVRRALVWQIEGIRMKPSKKTADANARARDARTMADLVRTLEKLDALEKRREGKTRKSKAASDADVKSRIVRRLDQLLARRTEDGVSGTPERG